LTPTSFTTLTHSQTESWKKGSGVPKPRLLLTPDAPRINNSTKFVVTIGYDNPNLNPHRNPQAHPKHSPATTTSTYDEPQLAPNNSLPRPPSKAEKNKKHKTLKQHSKPIPGITPHTTRMQNY
jgi:hypothetical protein